MSLWSIVSGQFGNPTGILGRLAGFIMSHRPSNVERNDWAIGLLELKPADTVLETGFGTGIAVKKMSGIVTSGKVFGLDHSELMLKKALKKNRAAITDGKVKLFLGSVADLPRFGVKIDKVLDVNSFQFWDDPVKCLKSIRAQMSGGGMIAIAHQPRKPGATDIDAAGAAEEFSGYLKKAGFVDIRIDTKIMKPVLTVCVTGLNN